MPRWASRPGSCALALAAGVRCGRANHFASTMTWLRRVRRHPSAFLLGVQLLSLVIHPLMVGSDSGRVLFGAFSVVVVLLAVWVVDRSPAATWVAWLIGVPLIALTCGAIVLHSPAWLVWSA